MKKRIFLVLFLLILTTGCASSDFNMNIDSKGNVSINHKLLFDKDTYSIMEELNDIELLNYDIRDIEENNMKGYTIGTTLGKITDLDVKRKYKIDLTKYLSKDFDKYSLFDCTDLIFLDKCSASYKIDLTNSFALESIINNDEEEYYNESLNKYNITKLNEGVITKFTLNSELKVGNNNSTYNNDNNYTWVLNYGEENDIDFVVFVPNRSRIAFLILLIILILIILFIKNKGKKNEINSRISILESLKKDDDGKPIHMENNKTRKENTNKINNRIRNSNL